MDGKQRGSGGCNLVTLVQAAFLDTQGTGRIMNCLKKIIHFNYSFDIVTLSCLQFEFGICE